MKKYVHMNGKTHASYQATPELAERVMGCIKELNPVSWKDHRGFSITGANYIIRIKHGDEWIRLE